MIRRWTPPSLTALRAFEAAARSLNFTRAAEELGQTQGAISHQVRDLEARLGVKLFERQARRLVLSEAAKRYLPYVRDALQQLRLGEDLLRGSAAQSALTVTLSPNFAAKWLVPRLGSFLETHPDIDLRISASAQHIDFSQHDIDLAIRHGTGDWPHLSVTRLISETLFPVCSPRLLAGEPPLRGPADLLRYTLIHDGDRSMWRQWLTAFGIALEETSPGPVLNWASLAIDAAVAGQGIALTRSALVARDLAAGRLVRPLAEEMPAEFSYWIVCPKANANLPKIERFRSWLLAQAQVDRIDMERQHKAA